MLTSPYLSFVFIGAIFFIAIALFIAKLFRNSSLHASSKKNYFVLIDVASADNSEFQQEFSTRTRNYNMLYNLLIFIFIIIIVITAIICGRPGKQVSTNQNIKSKQVMLCLDVSGSSLIFDSKIMNAYKNIIKNFNGEKIGLQIFDSSSKTIFPLTNDYKTVNIQIDKVLNALNPLQNKSSVDNLTQNEKTNLFELLSGTSSRNDSASLIGDGLMNCALASNTNDPNNNTQENSNSTIIFATDNQLAGNSIYSLDDAIKYTVNNNIKLHTIFSGDATLEGKRDESDLRNKNISNGAGYYTLQTDNSIDTIINKIYESSNANYSDNTTIIEDAPQIIILIFAIIYLIYILLCWRIKK